MTRNPSSPLLENGGFFVGKDPRRAIMVNAAAYAREVNRKPEPAVSFVQSLLMAMALVAFVGGGLLLLGGVS